MIITSGTIRQIRRRLQMSQVAFARFLSISTRTVVRWELGDSSPTGLYRQHVLRLKEMLDTGELSELRKKIRESHRKDTKE